MVLFTGSRDPEYADQSDQKDTNSDYGECPCRLIGFICSPVLSIDREDGSDG